LLKDRAQAGGFPGGLEFEALPREADGGDAGGEEVGIAVAVAFELLAVRVVQVTIELDDEPVVWEEDVGFVAGDVMLTCGSGNA
jgi:hypothetical protein